MMPTKMTLILKNLRLIPSVTLPAPARQLSITSHQVKRMPYKPEERPPMTPQQKKIYHQVEQEFTDEGYPVLYVKPKFLNVFETRPPRSARRSNRITNPRESSMPDNIDWPSAWPTAKSFVPSAVPLPLRQSYEKTDRPSLTKDRNAELLKIANFLHLTPVAVERHCKALKKFCVDWPEGLESDEEVRSHFPVTYVTRDHVNTGPTIRDARARVVDLKVHIDDLKLDNEHDKDKMIRLLRQRYDPKTGIITITADACPFRRQNEDYANYLLTACYFESQRYEKWEDLKEEEDWERFFWDRSESKKKFDEYAVAEDVKAQEAVKEPIREQYRECLSKIYKQETRDGLESYREVVEKMLGLSTNSEKVQLDKSQ